MEFFEDARIVESYFRRAGHPRIADRVRPSTRRRGTTEVEFVEDPQDSPDDAPGTGDAAAGPAPNPEDDTASTDSASEDEEPSPGTDDTVA